MKKDFEITLTADEFNMFMNGHLYVMTHDDGSRPEYTSSCRDAYQSALNTAEIVRIPDDGNLQKAEISLSVPDDLKITFLIDGSYNWDEMCSDESWEIRNFVNPVLRRYIRSIGMTNARLLTEFSPNEVDRA